MPISVRILGPGHSSRIMPVNVVYVAYGERMKDFSPEHRQ
jgi:hypothetical protein